MTSIDFSRFTGVYHPVDIYKEIFPQLKKLKNPIYVSGPITSGGAIRLLDQDPQLSISEIIKHNKIFAVALLELLIPDLVKGQEIIFPHQLGSLKLPNKNGDPEALWGEREYLSLWLMVISRMDPQIAQQYWDYLQEKISNHNSLNSHTDSRKKRVRQFVQLEEATISFIEQNLKHTNFVGQILVLPDSSLSLGCTLEKRLAQAFKIPTFEVQLNPDEITKIEHPIKHNIVYELLLQLNLLGTINTPSVLAALHPLVEELDYAI